jgi:tRNA pseudouridine55 synthase
MSAASRQQPAASLDGVLVIDKPAGPTSHDVVARMRRVLGTPRIGHTGTLDPFATGVLPLVIGRATRLSAFLSGGEKEYEAGIRFGLGTETYDGSRLSGAAIVAPAGLDRSAIEQALTAFRGTFDQMPPPYSAKKIEGVAAYKLARKNKPVPLRAVPVTVSVLVLDTYEGGLAHVRVRATAGFYVRSLAHDLGQRLGCGAHLESLRRTRAGAFTLEAGLPLELAESDPDSAKASVLPLERLLPEIPAVTLNDRGVWRATHGNEVGPDDLVTQGSVVGDERRRRLLDGAGRLLGIAETRPGDLLHPVLVLV